MPDTNDEIVFDDSGENLDDSIVAEEHQAETIKKLRDKLKAAEEKAKEYLGELQRAKADFVNMRKRDEEAKQEFVKFAKSDVLGELIPVLDGFNQAVSHGIEGVEPLYKLLMKTLSQHGLEEVNPAHQTFDPKLHEAIGVVQTENSEEDHQILEVVQKGYILSGKVIRPAKVRIGEYKINRY
ncbi:nucleotide exchange factor GrpE [Candidatus Parcubacteria bacterium]|nr:nucleotide exchange factor GrpE [Candidatus Parcubacteria bacterium]